MMSVGNQLEFDAVTITPRSKLIGHVSSRHVAAKDNRSTSPSKPQFFKTFDFTLHCLSFDTSFSLKSCELIHDRLNAAFLPLPLDDVDICINHMIEELCTRDCGHTDESRFVLSGTPLTSADLGTSHPGFWTLSHVQLMSKSLRTRMSKLIMKFGNCTNSQCVKLGGQLLHSLFDSAIGESRSVSTG